MRKRCLALCAAGLLPAGCWTGGDGLSPSIPKTPPPLVSQANAAPVARAQKPDERPTAGPPDARVALRVRAVVNGTPILEDELREATYYKLVAIESMPEPQRSQLRKQIEESELQRLIDREIVLSEAMSFLKKAPPQVFDKLKEAGAKEFDKTVRSMKEQAAKQGFPIKTDEEFKALLQQQGMTYEGIRRQIERSFMSMEFMRSRIYPAIEKISYEDVAEYYRSHPSEFQNEDRVDWQDLFLDASPFPDRNAARAFAEQVRARAQKGEDFLALVKQYNSGFSTLSDGRGMGQRRGEIIPREAEPILYNLKDGEVGPLVELPGGYHVIRLVHRDYAGLQPLDDNLQAKIRKILQSEIGEREYKRYLEELKKKAMIRIMASH